MPTETALTNETAYEQLCEVIPGGVNSPARACRAVGGEPLVAARAYQEILEDVEGNRYIDFIMSWGPLIHGHAHPIILEALNKKMQDGTSFGLTTLSEERLARKIISLIPSMEKVRFVSSGTEATMSAVRLARGFTQKEYIIKFNGNYHGHADLFLIEAGSSVAALPRSSSAGIPANMVQKTISLPYNDIEAWEKICSDPRYCNNIAAVILEPIAGNMGVVPALPDFLHVLREDTKKLGSLLIFDEVMTGFRVALGGAQEIYNIKPDLTVLGKIVGGGLPAAAFGGSSEIMNHLAPLGNVFQAGTLSGNPLAMEAGYQTLLLLEQENFYSILQQKTDFLTQRIRTAIKKTGADACLQQVGSMFTVFFGKRHVSNMEEAKEIDHKRFTQFYRYMIQEGILIPPSPHEAWFVSMAHSETNLEKTADVIEVFLINHF